MAPQMRTEASLTPDWAVCGMSPQVPGDGTCRVTDTDT